LRGERGGAREHGEGVFLADPIKSRDGAKHAEPLCRLKSAGQFIRSCAENQSRGAARRGPIGRRDKAQLSPP
jgi:hypothetical protein